MKLVELKCRNCGSQLKAGPGDDDICCDFCKSKYKLDDEIKHLKCDDMEKAGYEFEKGRLKAREEYEASKQKNPPKKEKRGLFRLIKKFIKLILKIIKFLLITGLIILMIEGIAGGL